MYGIDPENNGLPFYFIKNNLFFTDTNAFDVDVKVKTASGITLLQQTCNETGSVYKFEITLPNQLLLVENDTYQLTIDNIKYSCVCKSHDNYLYLGNGSLVNSYLTNPEIEEDNGQPFVLYMNGQSGPYFETDSPSIHNIILEGNKIKQLSEEYVPDSIARIDYVNEKIENIDLTPYETTENASLKLNEAKAYTDTIASNKADKEHIHSYNSLEDKPFEFLGEKIYEEFLVRSDDASTEVYYYDSTYVQSSAGAAIK